MAHVIYTGPETYKYQGISVLYCLDILFKSLSVIFHINAKGTPSSGIVSVSL